MKQINQTAGGGDNANGLQPQTDKQPSADIYRPRLLPATITTTALALIGGVGVWFFMWASAVFTDTAAAINFVTQSALSLFVLLAVVAQGCIYWSQRGLMKRQWDAMQGQLEAMKDGLAETHRLVEQNERAVEAAEQSIEIAQQNMVYAQRAYVLLSDPKVEFRQETYIVAQLDIMNFGNTPASNVAIVAYFKLLDSEPESLKEGTFEWTEGGIIIAPHASHSYILDLTISQEERRSFNMRERNLYAWGVIRYKDIFGKIRHSHFRVVMILGLGARMNPCTTGNEAD